MTDEILSMSKDLKIEIDVTDPIVLELLPGYIKHRKLEIFQLQRLLEESQYNKIRIIGHNLRGSGGLYGLPAISIFGENLEASAVANDVKALTAVIKDMQAYLDQIHL